MIAPEHDTRALALMVAAACAWLVALLLLNGCTVHQMKRGAISAEKTIEGLGIEWEQRLDDELARCVSAHHIPGPARDECIAPAESVDDAVAASEAIAVAALRAFWLGVAAGASPDELTRLLGEVAKAVDTFPVEAMRSIGGGQ